MSAIIRTLFLVRRLRAIASIAALLCVLTSCGGGGAAADSSSSASTGDAMQVRSAVLAPNVIALSSGSDGLVMTKPAVFTGPSGTPLKEGSVFLRDGFAFKVSFVDVAGDGSRTIYTVPPKLEEIYSDLRISGRIDASVLNAAQKSSPLLKSARPAAATSGSLAACFSSSPIGTVANGLEFGLKLGFSQCALDTTDVVALTFDGTIEFRGSIAVDIDLKSKTFLFIPKITISPSASLALGKKLQKDFDELVVASFSLPPGVLGVPLDIDFGIQISANASGQLQTRISGAFEFAPGQTGTRNGSAVPAANPSFTANSLTLDPLGLGIDASLTIEPFVAVAIGKSIGSLATIDIARFRFLAGMQVDAGASLSAFPPDACGTFAVSPVAHADFAPAYIEIGSIHVFDTPFTFFSHEWEPVFPVRPAGCVYGSAAQIDVLFPTPAKNATLVRLGQSTLTLSGANSVSRESDPITSYSWSILGVDALSGIQLSGADSSELSVNANGLQAGQAATVQLTVTTAAGKKAYKEMQLVGNQRPIASGTIRAGCSAVTLDASTSHDNDGRLVQWKWTLPDGRTIRQRAVNPIDIDLATLARPLVASLTVTDEAGDSTTGNVAELVGQPPVIVSGPVSTSVQEGQRATFSIAATGSCPLSYQWRRNGVNVDCSSGANCPSYTTPPLTLADSGSSYTVVVVNAAGLATSAAATVTVTASSTASPDLVAQNITFAPGTVAPGANVQINWALANQGSATAGPSSAVVRINQSSTSAAGANLATVGTPSLLAGASILANGAVVQAPMASGTYRVWVVVDNNSTAGQSTAAAANDIALASGTLTVNAPATSSPDLVVQNINFTPGTVSPGGNVQVSWALANQGNATAGASNAVVRINQSATSAAGANLATVSTPTLAAGASVLANGAVVVAPTTPGTYRVWVLADNNSTSGQSVTAAANDIALASGTLTVAGSPTTSPDLIVQNINFTPGTVAPGGNMQVSWALTNQGNATAGASYAVVRINQSTTSATGANLATVSTPSLIAGASILANGAVVTAPTAPGLYRVWVLADNNSTSGQNTAAAANDIVLATGTLTVSAPTANSPDLAVTSISFGPTSVAAGANVQVLLTMSNLGSGSAAASTAAIRITQSNSSSAGANAGMTTIPALLPGASIALPAVNVVVPAAPGTYRIWVVADVNATAGQPSSATANDAVLATATLTVTAGSSGPVVGPVSASPQTLVVGGPAVFSVTGTGLQPGYTFSLPGCSPTEVVSSSSTVRQFTCTLTQAGTNLQGGVYSALGALLASFSVTVAPNVAAPGPGGLYVGYYAEDAITNPEDPGLGALYFTVPATNAAFSGAMYFTVASCQSNNVGAISGTKSDASITGSWSGTVDGILQSGGYAGSYGSTLSAYAGTYTVSRGKQFVTVTNCVQYYVAPNGFWEATPVGGSVPSTFRLTTSGTSVSWTNPVGTILTLVSVIDEAEALSGTATAVKFQAMGVTGTTAFNLTSVPGLIVGRSYIVSVTTANSKAQRTGVTSARMMR